MQRASVVTTAGDAITILRGISCLSPRGKYDITIYPTYFSLHGKTYDFKIPASTVMRLFLLPHKGKKNYLKFRYSHILNSAEATNNLKKYPSLF